MIGKSVLRGSGMTSHEDFESTHSSEGCEFTYGHEGLEFTYDSYRNIIDRLQSAGYDFKRFGDQINTGDVLLRHDVDWSPSKALRMARIEHEYDVTATYFFLLSCPLYNMLFSENRRILKEIRELGHDVGLHFNTHQYWDSEPPNNDLEARVEDERQMLLTLTGDLSPAVSFHMPPDWILNKQFESFQNTYAKKFLTDIEYVADSRQRWREEPPFEEGLPDIGQILVHPGSWGEHDATFEERFRAARANQLESTRNYMEVQYFGN